MNFEENMDERTARSFPAKLLLFGEYSILLGSKALAIPFPRFNARLELPGPGSAIQDGMLESNHQLASVYRHFMSNKSVLPEFIDLDRFGHEVEAGLWCQSTIPRKYGTGSSGALCAALYDRFRKPSYVPELKELRDVFAVMESYFHGRSSGFDPLVSYIGTPLLIPAPGQNVPVAMPQPETKGLPVVSLIDTGISCSTGPLVQDFLSRFAPDGTVTEEGRALVEHANRCIDLFLNPSPALPAAIQTLSRFQFRTLRHLIPDHLHRMWEEGLRSERYAVKLCGSGGGGFLLSFGENTGEPVTW